MELPNLDRIIDTYIPLNSNVLTDYLNQLRSEVLPPIRKMQKDDQLRWFSFLLHRSNQLNGRESESGKIYIHLRLEPSKNIEIEKFLTLLPQHFLKPQVVTLPPISNLECNILKDENWAYAWKIHGEGSEWVLNLIEGHKSGPSPEQIIQFLHFITNSLMFGGKCICIPGGYLPF